MSCHIARLSGTGDWGTEPFLPAAAGRWRLRRRNGLGRVHHVDPILGEQPVEQVARLLVVLDAERGPDLLRCWVDEAVDLDRGAEAAGLSDNPAVVAEGDGEHARRRPQRLGVATAVEPGLDVV